MPSNPVIANAACRQPRSAGWPDNRLQCRCGELLRVGAMVEPVGRNSDPPPLALRATAGLSPPKRISAKAGAYCAAEASAD
jgi:hypothetical protein